MWQPTLDNIWAIWGLTALAIFGCLSVIVLVAGRGERGMGGTLLALAFPVVSIGIAIYQGGEFGYSVPVLWWHGLTFFTWADPARLPNGVPPVSMALEWASRGLFWYGMPGALVFAYVLIHNPVGRKALPSVLLAPMFVAVDLLFGARVTAGLVKGAVRAVAIIAVCAAIVYVIVPWRSVAAFFYAQINPPWLTIGAPLRIAPGQTDVALDGKWHRVTLSCGGIYDMLKLEHTRGERVELELVDRRRVRFAAGDSMKISDRSAWIRGHGNVNLKMRCGP